MPTSDHDHDAQMRLLEKVDALATGQADIAARLTVIEGTMREHREDDRRRADKLEAADEKRAQALLMMDEKRVSAIQDIEHDRQARDAKTDKRLTKLEADAAQVTGFRKHVLGMVISVLTALATAWAAIKMGFGGDK